MPTQYAEWLAIIAAVPVAIAAVAGGVCLWHLLVDRVDGWKISHEGVDEETTALGRPRAALHTPTQEMPPVRIFTVPQEWVEEARRAGLQVGRHYAAA